MMLLVGNFVLARAVVLRFRAAKLPIGRVRGPNFGAKTNLRFVLVGGENANSQSTKKY